MDNQVHPRRPQGRILCGVPTPNGNPRQRREKTLSTNLKPILKLLFKTVVSFILATAAATSFASETVTAPTEEKPTTVEGLIRWHAARHGVDPDVMVAVATCESNLNPTAVGDLHLGVSRGIFQISRRWHPEVSDAEAHDPDFASRWAAEMFAAGHARQWTCYRNLFG